MFVVGQYVIHPRYGAGSIVELAKTIVNNLETECYVIDPLLKEIIIKVPINKATEVGLRSPLSLPELEGLLKFLSEPWPIENQFFLRTSKIPQEISLNDPLNILTIIKGLFYEKIFRQQEGNNLSLSKRRMYSLAISLLGSEIVATCGCSLDEACFTIRNSLVFNPIEPLP